MSDTWTHKHWPTPEEKAAWARGEGLEPNFPSPPAAPRVPPAREEPCICVCYHAERYHDHETGLCTLCLCDSFRLQTPPKPPVLVADRTHVDGCDAARTGDCNCGVDAYPIAVAFDLPFGRGFDETLKAAVARFASLQARLAEAERERDRMRDALSLYGDHLGFSCAIRRGRDRCTCGFAAALSSSPGDQQEGST